MIPLATAEEMRHADGRASERYGVPSLLLMENAGRGATDAIERGFGPVRGRRVAVVCGRGNNGGDGFVVARHLLARGAAVEVWLAGRPEEVGGDAATNLVALRLAGQAILPVEAGGALLLEGALARADLVVDAVLGTGVRGAATGPAAVAIDAINRAGRPVCALDLPSGLSSESADVLGPTVRATVTVTFGVPKLGLFLEAGRAHAGRVEVADLGVPRAWLEDGLRAGLLEAADVASLLPPRPGDAHKGRFGHLLVVAGSLGKTGAAALAARGALRVGTGLVTCALPASQQPVVAGHLAEAMTVALGEPGATALGRDALPGLLELAGRMDAVALGPGSGIGPGTQALLRDLVAGVERPMVVDADALTALAGQLDIAGRARAPRLLTPHPGEAARLLGESIGTIQRDRPGSARRLAQATGAVIALKGAWTVVATPDGEVALNPTGNPGMATGGMGDVLTGVAGGLLAQGLAPVAALQAAVYLHGLAADVVAESRGEAGLLAGDVADALPEAVRRVRRPVPG